MRKPYPRLQNGFSCRPDRAYPGPVMPCGVCRAADFSPEGANERKKGGCHLVPSRNFSYLCRTNKRRAHSSVGQSSGLIIRRSWDHAPLGPLFKKSPDAASGLFLFAAVRSSGKIPIISRHHRTTDIFIPESFETFARQRIRSESLNRVKHGYMRSENFEKTIFSSLINSC